jgi:hypothetical protein
VGAHPAVMARGEPGVPPLRREDGRDRDHEQEEGEPVSPCISRTSSAGASRKEASPHPIQYQLMNRRLKIASSIAKR